MTKRFTTVELPKPNKWGIWYDGACLSTYQVCILLNEYVDVKKENEQLKCGNKNLKATLNDFINILNRLQSNPTDKQILAVARDMLQNMGKELEE